ncbi:MAG TPA: PilZ domain-containing protein [Kofleriaceae bacterium]|nr:PilZ domain-containing protein [Kofleriaceae bacterium]
MTDERRGSPRLPASLAGELENTEGKTAIAITRDVGAAGLLVYTRLRECTGEVKLKVVHDEETMVITGTVVRMEPVEGSTLWRNKVAISIDPEDPSLAKLFQAIQNSSDTDEQA